MWVYDFLRTTFTRLTFAGQNMSPVWTADSKSIYYMTNPANGKDFKIVRKPADGSRDAEELVSLDTRFYLMDVTRDGKTAFIDYLRSQEPDVATLALEPSAKPKPLTASPGWDGGATLSPDGRFMAYDSVESGRSEIYVRDLSVAGGRWQISTAGGEEPHWSADGRELYYRTNDLLMAAAIETTPAFRAAVPKLLFKGNYNLRSDTELSFSPDPKGGRFLMIRPATAQENASLPVRMVLNWFTELRASFAAR